MNFLVFSESPHGIESAQTRAYQKPSRSDFLSKPGAFQGILNRCGNIGQIQTALPGFPIGFCYGFSTRFYALIIRTKGLIGQSVIILDQIDSSQSKLIRDLSKVPGRFSHRLQGAAEQRFVKYTNDLSYAPDAKTRTGKFLQDTLSELDMRDPDTGFDTRIAKNDV
jgi:hypothetical protein